MKSKSCQVSFEFMMSIVIGMVVVVALVTLFSNKLHEVVLESRDEQINTILNIIEDEVTFAKGAIAGYSRKFTLPITVEGENYSLNLTDGTIAVSYMGRDFTKGFLHNVNGSLCLVALNETTQIFVVERSATEVTLSSCPNCIPDFYNCSWYDARGICDELGDLKMQCEGRYCLCQNNP